jgi:hypothetical protein
MMGSGFQLNLMECVLSQKHDCPRGGGRPALFQFTVIYRERLWEANEFFVQL